MHKPQTWQDLSSSELFNEAQIDEYARDLIGRMTLKEKITQMTPGLHLFPDGIPMLWSYNRKPIPAGKNRRLGIPAVGFSDGPRGVVMQQATCFPVSMARGAAWDVKLEESIGDAIGVEVRSLGANFYGGVCINMLRHPGWGRAQETYGEDTFLLAEMGAALTRGVQRHVMACAKHFALNSIENARFKVDVHVDERALREVYLPHFKRCVDVGVAAIMSAYNRVNGEWCSHHGYLLRKILKEEWGFRGFVMSDFVYGVHDSRAAILGGLDIEMPFEQYYGKKLQRLVEAGDVSIEVVDDAVLRILRQKIRFAQVGEPGRYNKEAVLCASHRNLARQAACKSIVLLKNTPPLGGQKPLLPLDQNLIIALIGRLANQPNIGDHGSSRVHPPYVVTPFQGLKAAVGNKRITYNSGVSIKGAAKAAKRADVAIVVVGYSYRDEGEYFKKPLQPAQGGDRQNLALKLEDEALIIAAARANPCTVVVMMGGSAIITEDWRRQVPAILMAWYPGMEGGHALADILFGKVNPSGKLPCTFPLSETQLPFFDRNAESIEYGYLHGYQLLDMNQQQTAFPFGFGLSYTRYQYQNLRLEEDRMHITGSLQASVGVTNAGDMAGEEVVQLYVGCPHGKVKRPPKALRGFCRVALQPGETKTVSMVIRAVDLQYYDDQQARWMMEPGEYMAYVGASSRWEDLLSAPFHVMG